MPDSYNLIVNTEHRLIKEMRDAAAEALDAKVQPVETDIEAANAEITRLRDAAKAAGDKTDAETDKQLADLEKKVSELRDAENKTISDFAATQPRVKQAHRPCTARQRTSPRLRPVIVHLTFSRG